MPGPTTWFLNIPKSSASSTPFLFLSSPATPSTKGPWKKSKPTAGGGNGLYTASFAEQVTLEDYKDYNSKTYFVSKSPDKFKDIRYYPTIVLYNDGEEELRIESGISLKLPEDWKEQLNEHIDLLLSQRF